MSTAANRAAPDALGEVGRDRVRPARRVAQRRQHHVQVRLVLPPELGPALARDGEDEGLVPGGHQPSRTVPLATVPGLALVREPGRSRDGDVALEGPVPLDREAVRLP